MTALEAGGAPNKPAIEQLGGTAAGVVAAFTSAVGALGFSGAGVGALLRNHRGWSTAALLALAVAFSLAVGSILADRKNKKTGAVKRAARVLVVGTAGAFVIGLCCTITAAVLTAGDHYQPSISASFKTENNAISFEGEVKANGLGAREHVRIRVFTGDARDKSIYAADQGPNTNGDVDAKISLPIRLGAYDRLLIMAWVGKGTPDCNVALSDIRVDLACVTLPVPSTSVVPKLTVSDGDKADALVVKVNHSGLDESKRVLVNVIKGAPGKTAVLYSTTIAGDGTGMVDATIQLPVPREATTVCVAARVGGPGDDRPPACPPQADATTTWANVAVTPPVGS